MVAGCNSLTIAVPPRPIFAPHGCFPAGGPRVTSCAFCGRENDAESRFCIDCGKPMNPSAARVGPAYVPHPSGGQPQPVSRAAAARPSLRRPRRQSACRDTRVRSQLSRAAQSRSTRRSAVLRRIAAARIIDNDRAVRAARSAAPVTRKASTSSAARCGNRVGQRVSVDVPQSAQHDAFGRRADRAGPRLALLGESGDVVRELHARSRRGGRSDAATPTSVRGDHFMSPLHARLELRDGQLWLRDLGSRNGTWVFIEPPGRAHRRRSDSRRLTAASLSPARLSGPASA